MIIFPEKKNYNSSSQSFIKSLISFFILHTSINTHFNRSFAAIIPIFKMGEPIPVQTKKFNTELTDYSVSPAKDKTGPYADNLEVDALIVGAGFAGIFMLKTLRDRGYNAVIYEAGNDTGVSHYLRLAIARILTTRRVPGDGTATPEQELTLKCLNMSSASRKSGRLGTGDPTIPSIKSSETTLTMSTRSSTSRRTAPSTRSLLVPTSMLRLAVGLSGPKTDARQRQST